MTNNENCTFHGQILLNKQAWTDIFHYSLDLTSNVRPLKRLLRIISVQEVLEAAWLLFCSGHWFQLRLNVMYGRLLKTSTSIAAYDITRHMNNCLWIKHQLTSYKTDDRLSWFTTGAQKRSIMHRHGHSMTPKAVIKGHNIGSTMSLFRSHLCSGS